MHQNSKYSMYVYSMYTQNVQKCTFTKMLVIVEIYSCERYLTQHSIYSQFGITICRTNAEQTENGFLLFS